MKSRLERFAEHAVRLKILGCLADGELLTIDQISARVGTTPPVIRYHTQVLAARSLVTLEKRSKR